jgi:hypothetical protein
MNFLCKLLLWSCLCCLLAMPVRAQEDGQGQAELHHHPPQDQLLHERFYSCTKGFIPNGTCPIILPLAVAMRRTAMLLWRSHRHLPLSRFKKFGRRFARKAAM